MKVLYFGMYNPNYPRNKNLIAGLRENGVEIRECNSRTHLIWGLRYLRLLSLFVVVKGWQCDVFIVGFPGQTDVPLAWFLGKIFRKKIIFDVFISLYNSNVDDRKTVSRKSGKAALFWWVDKISCELADCVLSDTQAHIRYFTTEFNLPVTKFRRLLVGTDEKIFYSRKHQQFKSFIIGFHGSFLPLQGVDIIIKAAKLLSKENVKFKILGDGPTHKNCLALAAKLNINNIQFLPWVPYKDLPDFIAGCDIYLGGPFGDNTKAGLVIPNKVYEAIACQKAVLVGNSPAIREIFHDKKDSLFVKRNNALDLAQKIIFLKRNPDFRNKIAVEGHKLFHSQATKAIIARELKEILYVQSGRH